MKYINYLFLFVAFIFSTTVFAQESTVPLPLNSMEHYEYNGESELLFHFQAQAPGVLAIAAEGIENSSISIILYDQYNQMIQRMGGDRNKTHAGQGIFIIPSQGEYTIGVQLRRNLSSSNNRMMQDELAALSEELGAELGLSVRIDIPEEFNNIASENVEDDVSDLQPQMISMTSSFIPTSSFASFVVTDKDDDHNPSKAIELSSDTGVKTIETTVGGLNEDPWDWWKVEGEFNIVLVSASTEQGDIGIRVYDSNKFERAWEEADETISGEESLIIRPESNEPIMLKIVPYYIYGGDPNREIHYTITVEAY